MTGPGRFERVGASNVPDKSCPAACSTMHDLSAVVFAGPALTATAGELVGSLHCEKGSRQRKRRDHA